MTENMLSTKVASNILRSIECMATLDSVSANYAVIKDTKGECYGIISLSTFDELAASKGKNSFKIADLENKRVLVHSDNKFLLKKAAKVKEIPEGTVVFPEENFVVFRVNNDKSKEREKFLQRVVDTTKYSRNVELNGKTIVSVKFEAEDDSIAVNIKGKTYDDFYAVPYVNLTDISELRWAVTPNDRDLKYAWVDLELDEALGKLLDLAIN